MPNSAPLRVLAAAALVVPIAAACSPYEPVATQPGTTPSVWTGSPPPSAAAGEGGSGEGASAEGPTTSTGETLVADLKTADGTSVAIRDKKLATQDLYSIGQTPLKFLLKEQISLERDTTVTGVSTKGDILSLKLEDRSTLGGTSKITLNFDLTANELRQWVVIDPQGYETSVSLYNLDTQRRPDQKNFVIDYQRVL